MQNSTNVHDAETGEDKTISQLQSELAAHSSASLDPEVFKEYVRGKFKLNFLVGPFYSKKLWAKIAPRDVHERPGVGGECCKEF